jgi:hypothetical protein
MHDFAGYRLCRRKRAVNDELPPLHKKVASKVNALTHAPEVAQVLGAELHALGSRLGGLG